MLAIKGIYDGKDIKPSEKIPFKEKRNVIITFLEEPVEKTDRESEIDPIKALRGCAKGTNLTQKLLKSRKEDLELEEAQEGDEERKSLDRLVEEVQEFSREKPTMDAQEALRELCSGIFEGEENLASNHDFFLYGAPKRK